MCSVVERCETGEVCDTCRLWFPVDADPTKGPDHAISDLVSETDESEVHTGSVKGLQSVGNIATQSVGEWRESSAKQ